jgi:hypothetical protein
VSGKRSVRRKNNVDSPRREKERSADGGGESLEGVGILVEKRALQCPEKEIEEKKERRKG